MARVSHPTYITIGFPKSARTFVSTAVPQSCTELSGRLVVITGVGRRGQVGQTVALAFAELGASVVAVDRIAAEVDARAAELREAGFRAEARVCDLTDESQVAALARDVADVHSGHVHALINLAGGFAMSGPVATSDFQIWRRQFEINLTSAYLATRAFLPLLRQARGAIVYFSSAAALPSADAAGMSAYAAAKSGVLALMRAVAAEERTNGVRANAVAPTAIRTAENASSMGENVRYVEREDVASVVTFLCSDQAKAVTGQVVTVS